jgi:hypothetical protein
VYEPDSYFKLKQLNTQLSEQKNSELTNKRAQLYYMGQVQFLFHIRHYMYLKWSQASWRDQDAQYAQQSDMKEEEDYGQDETTDQDTGDDGDDDEEEDEDEDENMDEDEDEGNKSEDEEYE